MTVVAGNAPADVRIEGVDLYYGSNHVLKGVNLDIRPGEFFAFLGPSGCGKTTLLRLIAGFARAQQGRVVIGGEDISTLPPWRRDVGLVFQSYALWPHMTVRDNVAFGLEERRVPKPEIERRVAEALDLVGLSELARRRPAQLSGGQQQRVALARTIVVQPKVLLLDEPLSNLDAKLRIRMRRELRELQQRLGLTAIFVTHDQEEANTICDRIAVMHDGRIQQVGAPMDLYEKPANLFVAGFLGAANILEGSVEGAGSARAFVIAGGARIPVPAGMTVPPGARLMFRPQHAALLAAGGAPPAGTLVLDGAVAGREFHGASFRYAVRVGGAEVDIDAPFRTGNPAAETGEPIRLVIDPGAVLWLVE
ncbi:MAG: ABC transporter ATP-binding protein [Alphaproteobacteria bacterium]|nr:ABC transporter ATP-binding protein [Alphaproteobacteria bacterium]